MVYLQENNSRCVTRSDLYMGYDACEIFEKHRFLHENADMKSILVPVSSDRKLSLMSTEHFS